LRGTKIKLNNIIQRLKREFKDEIDGSHHLTECARIEKYARLNCCGHCVHGRLLLLIKFHGFLVQFAAFLDGDKSLDLQQFSRFHQRIIPSAQMLLVHLFSVFGHLFGDDFSGFALHQIFLHQSSDGFGARSSQKKSFAVFCWKFGAPVEKFLTQTICCHILFLSGVSHGAESKCTGKF